MREVLDLFNATWEFSLADFALVAKLLTATAAVHVLLRGAPKVPVDLWRGVQCVWNGLCGVLAWIRKPSAASARLSHLENRLSDLLEQLGERKPRAQADASP